VARLRPHVTAIWTGGKNTRSFQSGAEPAKININTASRELLAALHEQLNEDDARDLWAYIHPPEPHPIESTSLQDLLSFHNAFSVEQTAMDLVPLIQPRSDLFSAHVTVEIMGDAGQGQPEVRTRRSVDALLQRKPTVGGKHVQVLAWRSE
jgi:Type II secretion system (T2SS), protein K